jgi:hypothetical protein
MLVTTPLPPTSGLAPARQSTVAAHDASHRPPVNKSADPHSCRARRSISYMTHSQATYAGRRSRRGVRCGADKEGAPQRGLATGRASPMTRACCCVLPSSSRACRPRAQAAVRSELDSRDQARWLPHDGAARRRGVRLLARNGHDWTRRFRLIGEAVEALRLTSCLIDGEAIAFERDGNYNSTVAADFRRREEAKCGH